VLRSDYLADSVDAFLGYVAAIKKEWFKPEDPWGPWFRGQRKAYYPLLPKLYREYGSYAEIRKNAIEDEIREEFIVRAPILSEARPADEWEWYFLMQHFGAPTRLLDWTDGALIGLYFAVKDSTGEHDAAV
jgi:FRG domain